MGEVLCQVRLLLPTMDALLLDATLDAIAASARACGEQRTPGRIRADAITAMTLQTLRTSQMAAYKPAATWTTSPPGAGPPAWTTSPPRTRPTTASSTPPDGPPTKDQTSGDLSWHTPDKTAYQRHPDATITRLPRKTGPHPRERPGDYETTPTQKPPTPSNQHPSPTTPHPSEAPGATDSDDQPTPLRRAARPLRLLLS